MEKKPKLGNSTSFQLVLSSRTYKIHALSIKDLRGVLIQDNEATQKVGLWEFQKCIKKIPPIILPRVERFLDIYNKPVRSEVVRNQKNLKSNKIFSKQKYMENIEILNSKPLNCHTVPI